MTENTPTFRDFQEALLKTVIGHGSLSIPTTGDGLPMHLNIGVVVNAYKAHRFLAALQQHMPEDALNELLADVWAVLEDGALPEYAWDDATAAGFDPEPWDDQVNAWARRLNERQREREAGRG